MTSTNVAPLVVVVGPTASGKSAFGIKLATHLNGEIICADSRTVYKGLDIGTAKPTPADQALVRHHLLDVATPDAVVTAAAFKRQANKFIDDIWQRGKLPIVVGGSGLYVDALIFDYKFGPPPDNKQREYLNSLLVDQLIKICNQKNIEMPTNHHNKRHLIRAIELGGLFKSKRDLRSNTLVVGISTTKEILRQRIITRAKSMLAHGVIEEANALARRYGWQSEAMKSNIYQAIHTMVAQQQTPDDMLEEVIKRDVALAKRQITWFKRNPYIVWGKPAELEDIVNNFVQNLHHKK